MAPQHRNASHCVDHGIQSNTLIDTEGHGRCGTWSSSQYPFPLGFSIRAPNSYGRLFFSLPLWPNHEPWGLPVQSLERPSSDQQFFDATNNQQPTGHTNPVWTWGWWCETLPSSRVGRILCRVFVHCICTCWQRTTEDTWESIMTQFYAALFILLWCISANETRLHC